MPRHTRIIGLSLAAVALSLSVEPLAAETSRPDAMLPIETPLTSPNSGSVTLALPQADPAVRSFYQARLDSPVWHDGDRWLPTAAGLLAVMAQADAHGLDPNHYLPQSPADTLAAPPSDALDVTLTEALLHYVRDVSSGRIPPKERPDHRYPHGEPPEDATAALQLAEVLASPDPVTALAAVQPSDPAYGRLKALLADLRRQRDASGGWMPIPDGPSVREGDADPRLSLVQTSLMLHGDLDAVTVRDRPEPPAYDAILMEAVKRFQARHGLTVDGILGRDTVRTLNVPIDDRIRQVMATMERLRWDPPPPTTGKFIEVNVPDYRLIGYDNGSPALTMTVVVGTEKNRTPLFTDYMDNVVLNPTWTVPLSIARNELLPKLRNDPGYTVGQNMDIFAGWSHDAPVIDPWAVDWHAISANRLSYRFVERAGPGNALGLMRFSLNNDFAIYLHDTPSKSLFNRPHRAFSHGCVRLEDYDALLGFVAGPVADRARQHLATGRTMTIRLPDSVPVRMIYHTAWVDEAGRPQFRRDVYGLDPEVVQRMREGGRKLIALKPQEIGTR